MNRSNHSALPQYVRESRLPCPGIKQTPVTNMLNFGLNKPVPTESGDSFLSLLCGPPSLLQYDFHHQSNYNSSSGTSSYPDPSTQYHISIEGSQPVIKNNANFNPRAGVGAPSAFSSRPHMGSNNGNDHGISGDFNSLRTLIDSTGSKTQIASNISLQNAGTCASANSPNGELALTGSPVLGAPLQTSSSVSKKQPSVVSGCPRVFCMGACGELLINNTGVFGILCSCHGSHMPVKTFCEHSGSYDVNPGYAVRMESGECISQWRKMYLEKFKIRAPEDHRGWDWPEELLATSHLANTSVAVTERRKVFDFSGLFTSSAESVKSIQPWNNVSISRARSSTEYVNQASKDSHLEKGLDPHIISFGRTGTYSHAVPGNLMIACASPECFTSSEGSWKEKSRNGYDSRFSNLNIFSTSGSSSGSAFHNSQSISSTTDSSIKGDIVSWRDNVPSSSDLKLGQPSPLGWGTGPTSVSASNSHISVVQATTFQEKLTHNLGHLKFTNGSIQRSHHHSASNLRKTKEMFRKRLVDSTPSLYGASHVVNSKHGFANSPAISVLTHDTSAGQSAYQKETTKEITDAHPGMPPAPNYLPNVARASLIDFSCIGDGPISPLETSKLASQNENSRSFGPRYGRNVSDDGSKTSLKLSPKKMKCSGMITSYGVAGPSNISRLSAADNSFGRDSLLPGTSGASAVTRSTYNQGRCSIQDISVKGLKNSSMGLGVDQILQADSTGSLLTEGLPPFHRSASLSKDIDAVSPYNSSESLRVPVLRNLMQSAKKCLEDSPRGSAQLLKNHAINQIQESKDYKISNQRLHGSFRDIGSLYGQIDGHQFPAGYFPTSRSDVGHVKGTISCQDSDAFQPGSINNYEVHHDTSLQQRYSNIVQPTCSEQEHEPKDTGFLHGFHPQASSAIAESCKVIVRKFNGDSALGKDNLPEYNNKGKKQMHQKLNCYGSQWRDVPSKTSTVSKMRCYDFDASTHLLDTRKESVSDFKELSAKETVTSKGKVLPNISDECSAPAVTQASNEVERVDSCAVDDGDSNYSDQIVDQGSAIVRGCSSVDAEGSQPAGCGEPASTETVSQITACHGVDDGFKRKHSKSNKLPSISFSEASFDTLPTEKQEHVNETLSRKRKHTTRWRMVGGSISVSEVSTSPADSTLHAGRTFSCQTQGARVCYRDPNGQSLKKQRSTLCQVKLFSQKRGRSENIVDSVYDDQRPLKGRDESINIPVKSAVKRLKSAESDKAVRKQVNSTKDLIELELSSLCSENPSRCSLKGRTKARPVACGKYGIICDQELNIDKLRPPKIVPLCQVLKASKRRTKLKYDLAAPLMRERTDVLPSASKEWLHGSDTAPSIPSDKVLPIANGNPDAPFHENQKIFCQDNEHPAADGSFSDDIPNNRRKRHPSLCGTTKWLTKGIRLRSLYELSMKGNKFISADLSLSQNVMCVSPTECELERKASGDARESDSSECRADARRFFKKPCRRPLNSDVDALCCVCGISDKDNNNCLLECGRCPIRIHQACYGISRMPKGEWFCRPCRTSSKDVVCVLCGYGDGAMTRAFGSRNVVRSLLNAWNIRTESHIMIIGSAESFSVPAIMEHGNRLEHSTTQSCSLMKPVVHNSVVAGLFNPTVKQWVHMVCGLWTPGTRCPNVDTMSAFDVSGVYNHRIHVVCDICKRSGGSCIRCRVDSCCAHFHPWCAHQKGLLQSEIEGVDSDKVGFYGRCLQHASNQSCTLENDDIDEVVSDTRQDKTPTCARTEAYAGKKNEGRWKRPSFQWNGKSECHFTQVQLEAWNYINKHKLRMKRQPSHPVSDVEHDYRKEYARFKQVKGWKQLVVYKSGIHAFGLYTSQYIARGAMVVEYIGEVVGLRVADKRETEYLSGRKLQYKSACYFFRIDKEHIIDATFKGGIARFVNHSCQPNCIARVITIRSEKKVVFLAQKDIYPGEEITYDYHFNREDEGKKIPCFCNAKNCRRYLN